MIFHPSDCKINDLMRSLILTILLLAGNALADTRDEINHLLDFVAGTACQYDRNGTVHNGAEAKDHINIKYEHYRKKIKTAEDFIKYSATKSMISGRKYKIHCPDSEVIDASDWLLEELHRYRNTHERKP